MSQTTQRPAPLYICPTEPESVTFPTHWYRLPNNDDFLICTKCYEDKIYSTQFANVLRCDKLDFGHPSQATCEFNSPRIDALLRQGIASHDFQPLRSFCDQRLTITACAGTEGTKGRSNVKWFRPVHNEIDGFVCCEACYEDCILASSFASKFAPSAAQQKEDELWSCDLAVPYLRRIAPGAAQIQDWNGFVQAASHRISLSECKGATSVYAYTRKWYNTATPSPISHLAVCEACFLDNIGWQPNIAQHWAQFAVGQWDFSSQYICDMQVPPMAACASVTLAYGMYEKWHHYASLVMSKPQCKAEGIVDGEWYGIPDPTNSIKDVQNFEICAACHAGWNQSADFGHLFRRLSFPPGTTRVCDFNASAPRYTDWITKWKQMYLTRDPGTFVDYVARLSNTSECQGFKRLENAVWYGDREYELLICPACFHEVVHGTYFASTFPLQNKPLPSAQHCSLYSRLMRQRYIEACTQRSLDALFTFTQHREQIYQEVISQLESFLSSQSAGLQRLKILSNQRVFSVGVASMSNAFSGHNPIVHNYNMGIMPLTIGVDSERRKLIGDPRRPAMIESERR